MSELNATPNSTVVSTASGLPAGLVGTAGVALVALDGTVLIPRSVAGITSPAAGIYLAELVAPEDDGDYLIVWDDGAGHTAVDVLHVRGAGSPYVPAAGNDAIATLAELRTYEPLDTDEVRYPDELVLAVRDAVIEALEHECRVSFVRRTITEHFNDPVRMRMLAIERHRRPVVTALNVDGADVTLLDGVSIGKGGLVHRIGGAFGRSASITYESGYDVPPGRVRRGVKLLTRDWLVEQADSALPSRATMLDTGEASYRLVTAGVAGAIFDFPEANAIVAGYRE